MAKRPTFKALWKRFENDRLLGKMLGLNGDAYMPLIQSLDKEIIRLGLLRLYGYQLTSRETRRLNHFRRYSLIAKLYCGK